MRKLLIVLSASLVSLSACKQGVSDARLESSTQVEQSTDPFQLVDLHVHLKGNLTIDEAIKNTYPPKKKKKDENKKVVKDEDGKPVMVEAPEEGKTYFVLSRVLRLPGIWMIEIFDESTGATIAKQTEKAWYSRPRDIGSDFQFLCF